MDALSCLFVANFILDQNVKGEKINRKGFIRKFRFIMVANGSRSTMAECPRHDGSEMVKRARLWVGHYIDITFVVSRCLVNVYLYANHVLFQKVILYYLNFISLNDQWHIVFCLSFSIS